MIGHHCPVRASSAYWPLSAERVMTDNGSCYLSRTFGRTCKKLGLKHIRTKPYTRNGKAERFIQTSLREWAYARAYNTQTNAPPSCCDAFTATIGTGLMAVSAQGHPSAALA
jgi:transposase InsO family protein